MLEFLLQKCLEFYQEDTFTVSTMVIQEIVFFYEIFKTEYLKYFFSLIRIGHTHFTQLVILKVFIYQKQPLVFCKKRCSQKFRKIHRKTPMPEACSFIKKTLWHRCFPLNFSKFLRTPSLQNTSWRLLLIYASFIHKLSVTTSKTLSSTNSSCIEKY